MEDRRCLRDLGAEAEGVEERTGGSGSSGSLVEGLDCCFWDEEDRCWRCFDLSEVEDDDESFLLRSLLRSRSFSLSGRNMARDEFELRKDLRFVGRKAGEDGEKCCLLDPVPSLLSSYLVGLWFKVE